MLTVRDIMKLENLRNFQLVSGEGGLDRFVSRTGIVDFEFVPDLALDRPVIFEENSFVLSSLLFAQGDEEILYKAIHKLIEMGVSGLAYKDVIFKELPKNVIELSNREDFPIFVFDDGVYFEDAIADLSIAIREDSQLTVIELKIRELVKQDYSRNEVRVVSERIFPKFAEYVMVFLCSARTRQTQLCIDRVYRRCAINRNAPSDMAICRYGKDLFIVISAEHQNTNKYFSVFRDVLFNCSLSTADIICGVSTVKQSWLDLDTALRESIYAHSACDIFQKELLSFSNLGIYQFLLPCEQNNHLNSFVNRYLDPIILEESEQNRKHMETAIAYIVNGGQLKETAEKLNIHENTARYRISKLKEKLDPKVTEYEFFANLYLAIRLNLLKNMK
jgi:sugar diacid utilization regulator